MSRRDELLDLADAVCRGTATGADRDRLEAVLAADRSLWPVYLDYLYVHQYLHDRFARPDAAPRPAARRRWFAPALAAAAVLLATGVAVWWRPGGPRPDAVLTRDYLCAWATPGVRAGAAVPPGRVELASGLAELTFASGAVVTLEGPAAVEVTGPARVSLRSGGLVARVPDGSVGFAVDTDAGRVLDLGTEFGVGVGGDGSATVQVYEGAVVAADRRLAAGEAVLLRPARVEAAEFRPQRFVRQFPPAESRGETARLRPYNRAAHAAVRVLPPPGPVAIDGDLADWDRSGGFDARCEEPFADYGLRGWLMADEKYLYAAAAVADPNPMEGVFAPGDEMVWRGGAVQLRVSADPALGWPVDARKYRPGGPSAADASDRLCHLTFWHHRATGAACLEVSRGMLFDNARVDPPGFAGAFRRDADGAGYVLEYAVPWEVLGCGPGRPGPRAGDVTGCNWTAHWAAPGGRVWRGQLVDVFNPAATGWPFHDAATWGKAEWLAPMRP